MEETTTTTPPTVGGWLHLRGRLTGLPDLLLPTWALLCGVVASGGFAGGRASWFRLAFLVLLVDGGWGTLWHALTTTDWATPFRRWREWHTGDSLPLPPYTLPGTPGDRAIRYLGQLHRWWQTVMRPSCGSAISAILVTLPVTLVLAIYLGFDSLLLTLGVLALIQLDAAWTGGTGSTARRWDALIGVTWPWLAGHAAFATPTLPSAAMALAFALAWGGQGTAPVAQALAAILLVFLHSPLGAGGILLLLTPQLMLRPWTSKMQTPTLYARHVRLWLLPAMAVAAFSLG